MGFLVNVKTVTTALHFPNEAWQVYVIGKNCKYFSHMASNLQGGALPAGSSLRKQRHSCWKLCVGSLWRAQYFPFPHSQQPQSLWHVSSIHFLNLSIPLESWGEWGARPPTYPHSLQRLAFAQLWVPILLGGNPFCLSLDCPQWLCLWRIFT